ncbi:MAG: hypothetical protein LBM08_11885, partial [Dysgonamonadaceae bacterium]|nr:hypothetical protein [Dysgonamonadaceae bacterium]
MERKSLPDRRVKSVCAVATRRCLLRGLLSLLLLAAVTGLRAQSVLWMSGFPSFNVSTASVITDEVDLNLHFQIIAVPLSNGKLQLELPAGIEIGSIERNAGNSVTLNLEGLDFPVSNSVEIPISGINTNSEIRLRAKVRAVDCSQTGTKIITAKILSNETAIPLNGYPGVFSKSASLTVLIPNITATGYAASVSLGALTESNVYNVTLGVSNAVTVKELKIELLKQKYTTLSEFKLGGTPIPSTAITPMDSVVILELTDGILLTPMTMQDSKLLSFKAQSSIGGPLQIIGKSVYPITGNCEAGVNEELFRLTLSYNAIDGTGALGNISGNFIMDPANNTSVNATPAFDGSTTQYYCRIVRNTGIPITKLRLCHSYSTPSFYPENTPVYYRIGSGSHIGALKTFDPSDIITDSIYNRKKYSTFVLKPEFIGKNYNGITLDLKEPIPHDAYLSLYIPIVQGDIIDNHLWEDEDSDVGISAIYSAWTIHGLARSNLSVIEDQSWDAHGNSIKAISGTYYQIYWFFPAFTTSSLVPLDIKAGEAETTSLAFGFSYDSDNTNLNRAVTFNFQLPPWLMLDASDENYRTAIDFGDNRTTQTPLLTGTLLGTNNAATDLVKRLSETGDTIYSFTTKRKGVGDGHGVLKIRYKALPPGSGPGEYPYTAAKVIDTIRYWADWHPYYGQPNNPLFPTIQYVTKQIQRVECAVVRDGITLDDFSIKRITRGQRVYDGASTTTDINTRTPAATVEPALDALIDHRMYLPGDTGRISIQGTIDNGHNYKYLYVLLSRPKLNRMFQFDTYADLDSVEIDGVLFPAEEIVFKDSTQACIKFKYPDNKDTGFFPAGATQICIRFHALDDVISYAYIFQWENLFKLETYVAVDEVNDPFDPGAARYGVDALSGMLETAKASGLMSVRDMSGGGTNVYPSFPNNNPVEFGLDQMGTSLQGSAMYPYPYEYRPYIYPQKYRVTMETGLIPGQLRIVAENNNRSTHGHQTMYVNNPVAEDNPNGTITYEYDLSQLFDPNPTPTYANADFTTNGNKWILPDDAARYQFYLSMTALPMLSSNSVIEDTLLYAVRPDFDTSQLDTLGGLRKYATYSGVKMNLSFPGAQTIYSNEASISPLTVSVKGGTAENFPFWLYVEGEDIDASTLSLTLQGNGNVPNRLGRWISLGNILTSSEGTNAVYTLKYKINNLQATGNSVRIHLISGYGDEDLSALIKADAPLSVIDSRYRSLVQTFTSTPSTASRLGGYITAATNEGDQKTLVYEEPYTVTVHVESGGNASVFNPSVKLTKQAGQEFISVKYKDASHSEWTDVPSDAVDDSHLEYISLNTSAFSASGDYVLAGLINSQVDGYEDCRMEFQFTFQPECETPLSGIQYAASFAGKNLLGGDANIDADRYLSEILTPDIQVGYGFTVSMRMIGDSYAFGGSSLDRTLELTVTKDFSDGSNSSLSDYIRLELPKWLEIQGAIGMSSSDLDIDEAASVASSTPDDDNRQLLSIQMPVSQLNGYNNGKGQGIPVLYNIPVKYRQTNETYLTGNPNQKITVDVYTMKNFSPNAECPDLPYSMCADTVNVSLISLSTSNPYLFDQASINEPFELNIASSGFNGTWHSLPDLTDDPVYGTYYAFTPTTPETRDLYVTAQFDDMPSSDSILIHIKTPPAELFWRKAGTDDKWLNPDNWEITRNGGSNPGDYLPALSSIVTLPSDVSTKYPVLTDTVACHIIRFEHGAELGRQDLLHYDSARVELKIGANQWYMFSPPLHDMYSGDFY